MKKTLVLSVAAFVIFAMSANNVLASPSSESPLNQKCQQPMDDNFGPPHSFKMNPECKEKMKQEHQKRKAEMDARLKLTDEQKCIIDKNRMESRQKMKPLFEEMKAKKAKLAEVCASGLSQVEKDKQMNALKSEIKDLRATAHKLREENMKKFESILSPAQKIEFEKMRQEHKSERAKHQRNHKGTMSPPSCSK